ncbi:putative membrane protein [Candidatus Phytoplasma solani]
MKIKNNFIPIFAVTIYSVIIAFFTFKIINYFELSAKTIFHITTFGILLQNILFFILISINPKEE